MPPPPRRSGLGVLVAAYRANEQGDGQGGIDFAARMQPSEPFVGPRTGEVIGSDPAAPGFGGPPGANMPGPFPPGVPGQQGRPGDPAYAMQNGSHRAPGQPDDLSMPATGVLFNSAELNNVQPPSRGRPDVQVASATGSPKPSSSLYGLLTVFTLMDGAGDAFDRLAEETVEAVRRSEPDTLIFICHSVKSAPLQRIVYEIYRDEVAFTEHQRQPHMERFARERVAHVLAANVIELNVNAAKVVPLPTAFRM
jgi:quinol monooxygenase YgiN